MDVHCTILFVGIHECSSLFQPVSWVFYSGVFKPVSWEFKLVAGLLTQFHGCFNLFQTCFMGVQTCLQGGCFMGVKPSRGRSNLFKGSFSWVLSLSAKPVYV